MNDTAKPQPSGAYRWLVLLSMGIALYGSAYVFDCIGPLAPLLSRQLHFSDANIGLLQAIYSFPNIIMVLIGGVIIDRIGTKKSFFLLGIICFIGAIITALSPHLSVMVIGRLISGLGAESLAVASWAANARWFRKKELSLSYGVKGIMVRFGSLSAQMSPAWAPRVYTYWKWPLLMSVGFGGFIFLGALLYWMLESHAERRYELGTGNAGHSISKLPLREAIKLPVSFWLVVGVCTTFYAAILPFETFAQKFFIDAKQVTPQMAALLVGMVPFFSMVGMPLFGHLADRIGKRSLLMIVGSGVLVPVYLMYAYTDVPVVVPAALMGLAFALVPAVMWPCVAYVVDERRFGFAYGLIDAVQMVGLVAGNLLIGLSNDHWAASATNPAGYRPGMWLFTTIALSAVVLAVLLRRVETGRHAHGLETITSHS